MFNLTYFQIERTSSNLRGDSLLNHISSIFVGQPVQGEPVREIEDVGGVVEVAVEVRHDDPQISVPAVQAPVEVLHQAQQVAGFHGGPVARSPVLSLFVVSLRTLLELLKSSPTHRVLPFRNFSFRSHALVSL